MKWPTLFIATVFSCCLLQAAESQDSDYDLLSIDESPSTELKLEWRTENDTPQPFSILTEEQENLAYENENLPSDRNEYLVKETFKEIEQGIKGKRSVATSDKPHVPVLESLAKPKQQAPLPKLNENQKEELAPQIAAATPVVQPQVEKKTNSGLNALQIDLKQVFAGSPWIYSVLILLSIGAVTLCLYHIFIVRSAEAIPEPLLRNLRHKLLSNQYDEAISLCLKENNLLCRMLASGILSRQHGVTMMVDAMKSEGKRATISFWQRLSLLNDIAVIAPMIGLLGTVVGMFYAFYDIHRSIESVSILFDGLGISVGTTVAGLLVAIIAMMLHSLARYRLLRLLAKVENEAQSFANLIDSRASALSSK